MLENITSQNFTDKILKSTNPVLVEVYTNSCPNCKILKPIVAETANANPANFSFYKLNAQENFEIAKQYKVLGVPTLLFFSHGILVDKKTGVITQQKIENKLNPLLNYTNEMAAKKQVKGFFKLPWK